MNEIPSAEEFISQHFEEGWQTSDFMIEFAKLHVEAALKQALIKSNVTHGFKDAILNSYPLDQIK
jgi:hypothetical protein